MLLALCLWLVCVADYSTPGLFDRAGNAASHLRLLGGNARMTSIGLSPGILLSLDEVKEPVVLPGSTIAGRAYLKGSDATIELADDWGDVMQRTSCG